MSDQINIQKPKVLLIDDEHSFRDNFKFTFEKELVVRCVPDMAFADRYLEEDFCDIILLDLALENDNYELGLPRIKKIKDKYPTIPIIVITNEAHPSIVIQALQNGADHFLSKGDIGRKGYEKDWLNVIEQKSRPRIIEQKNVALHHEKKNLEKVNQQLNQKVIQLESTPFIGESSKIKSIKEELLFIANEEANTTILITGETGVGKEVTARFIHQNGIRSDKPFQAVNLTEITPSLLASNLFGHKKGSFTDAKEDRTGIFEQANGGILFLDEIGEIDLEFQKKLLRFLENQIIRKVGGEEDIQLNVQIIAATNKDLPKAVEAGTFRRDFYQRLKVYPIHLPPLRERRSDIPLIMAHYLKIAIGDLPNLFTPSTYQQLLNYDWPGNVRELRHTIDYIKLRQRIKQKSIIDEACLPIEIVDYRLQIVQHDYKNHITDGDLSHKEALALADLLHIEVVLAESYSKKGIAAEKLKTNTDNLRYKIVKYYKEFPQLFNRLPKIVASYRLS